MSWVSVSGLVEVVRSRLASDRLLRNVGWFTLAEGVNRVSRLATIIVLARMLDSAEIGVAALALTCFELVRVAANVAVGPMIIQAKGEELAEACAGAWRASWFICVSTAAVQLAVGIAVSQWFARPDLLWLIAVLSGVFLVMPFGQVHGGLIARENRMGWIAGVLSLQIAADHLLCIVMALAGYGAWAIVLPKLIVAPIWVIGMRRGISWRRDRSVKAIGAAAMARTALPVIGSELLAAVRLNADKLLVSSILGVEALGIYYFAFNAGIGLSMALTTALAVSSYPHFAEVARRPADLRQRFEAALSGTGGQIALLIALQAALIPFYVPVILGARWEAAIPLAMMLCAGAVTKPAADLAFQLMRATGRASREFALSIAMTVVCLGCFAALLPFGLHAGVAALGFVMLWSHLALAGMALRIIPSHDDATTTPRPAMGAAPAVVG